MEVLSQDMKDMLRDPLVRKTLHLLMDDPNLREAKVTLFDGRTVTLKRVNP